MRRLLLAGAASLAVLCGAPLLAQNAAPSAAATAKAMTPQQKAAYDDWPADKKAAYDGWPAEYQAYYWSLSSNQQTGWWALSAEQRGQIMGMDAAQRSAAWVSIEAQLKGASPPAPSTAASPAPGTATATESASPADPPVEQVQANPRGEGPASPVPPAPATASSPVPPALPADPGYQAGPYKGALTAPPAEAMNKTYPLCSKTVQDSCRNRGGK